MPDEYQKFWTVLNVTNDFSAKRHPSYQSATLEAQRLAAKQPGQVFAVMTPSIAYCGYVSVENVKLLQPVEDMLVKQTEVTMFGWDDITVTDIQKG